MSDTQAVANGIYDRLASSAPLLALVAAYGSGKAIFTMLPIPPGVTPLFITVSDPIVDDDGPWETKNSAGRVWVRDIGVYDKNRGDNSAVDDAAGLVADLFHRKHGEITITGFDVMVASADGPVAAPTDDTMYGRIVTVTITAAEQS